MMVASFHKSLCHWSGQLFDLRAPSSTDVPVLLLNQPYRSQDGLSVGRMFRVTGIISLPQWENVKQIDLYCKAIITHVLHIDKLNCQRSNWAQKRGWLGGRIITPRNVGKNSQILRNPLKLAFWPYLSVSKRTPYLGGDVMVLYLQLVVRNWVIQCAAVRCLFRGPNRWASFYTISRQLVLWFAL